jgi:hypothetical protein
MWSWGVLDAQALALLLMADAAASGMATVKRVPCPTVLSHRMAPSCSRMMP